MKKLITLLCILCLCDMVFASTEAVPSYNVSDTKIKLEGFFGFQAGYRNQSKLSEQNEHATDNKKSLSFCTDAAFLATARQRLNDLTAGAKIVLLTTSKPKGSPNLNGSHVFLETDYGKVELGSPYDAGNKMRITGASIAVATAGCAWSKFAILDDYDMESQGMKIDFEPATNFYVDSFASGFDNISKGTEPSRKVSYYTPEMQGFQFGISYIPDSTNIGSNRSLKNLDKGGFSKLRDNIDEIKLPDINGVKGNKVLINYHIKNAVSAGMSYKYEILDDVAIQVAITGEHAKPVRKITVLDSHGNILSSNKLSNLNGYQIGMILTYGNVACGASYGSLGKSLTSKSYHKVGRDTKHYNGAIAYGQGPIKTSLSYFKSLKYRNTVDSVSLGTEYKLTPGLLPYAEISYFQAKGRPVCLVESIKKKAKGTVALIGARLKF